MFHEVRRCRVCANERLVTRLDLGTLALTGVFPKAAPEAVPRAPLELVQCRGDGACGLVQLRHTCDPARLFGDGYGYRSALNRRMVDHLASTVDRLVQRRPLPAGAVVLDIGSNDGTTLGFFPRGVRPFGVDPSAARLAHLYRPDATLLPEFFSAARFLEATGGQRAHVVTSIAMLYDLDDPVAFARDIAAALHDDGVWHFEQSHVGLMLEATAYDTICHEHLTYLGLAQVERILDAAGLRAVDAAFNDVNGGSFAVTAAKKGGRIPVNTASLEAMRAREAGMRLGEESTWAAFSCRVEASRREVRGFLDEMARSGRLVCGYGASTKGNVVLQHCGVTPAWMPVVAEVNPDKFGAHCPGTGLLIAPEADVRARRPDAMFVLPWHFRDGIVERERDYLASGGRLVFPLPRFEVVGAEALR
jgi:NDP-4-keto-2,6-dideoxyhexose 3-C-methyltransferase